MTYLLEFEFQDEFSKMQSDWLKLSDIDQFEIREYFNLYCEGVGDAMFDEEDPDVIIGLLQGMEPDGTTTFLNKLEQCRLVVFMEGKGRGSTVVQSKRKQFIVNSVSL